MRQMQHPIRRGHGTRKMTHAEIPSTPYPDFQALLGPTPWHALPGTVRARFDGTQGKLTEKIHADVMSEVRASRIGVWLAKLCVLMGTPIVPMAGRNAPVFVRLFHVPKCASIAWERLYRFPDHPTLAVRSTKMLNQEGALIEFLGFGLCMPLKPIVVNGKLHFVMPRLLLSMERFAHSTTPLVSP